MDDSTVFLIIMIYGNLSAAVGIIVCVKTRSLILGFLAWLFLPFAAVVLFFGMFGGGWGSRGSRVSMPNPQRFENNPYHHTRF